LGGNDRNEGLRDLEKKAPNIIGRIGIQEQREQDTPEQGVHQRGQDEVRQMKRPVAENWDRAHGQLLPTMRYGFCSLTSWAGGAGAPRGGAANRPHSQSSPNSN